MLGLRSVLRVDGILCLALGAALAVYPATLASVLIAGETLFGFSVQGFLRGLGLGLLAVGGWCLLIAGMRTINTGPVLPVLLVDVTWFLGAMAVLVEAWPALTPIGVLFVIASAAAVAAFFVLEIRGLGIRPPIAETTAHSR